MNTQTRDPHFSLASHDTPSGLLLLLTDHILSLKITSWGAKVTSTVDGFWRSPFAYVLRGRPGCWRSIDFGNLCSNGLQAWQGVRVLMHLWNHIPSVRLSSVSSHNMHGHSSRKCVRGTHEACMNATLPWWTSLAERVSSR